MLWLNLSSKSITATDCVLIFLAILYIYLFIYLSGNNLYYYYYYNLRTAWSRYQSAVWRNDTIQPISADENWVNWSFVAPFVKCERSLRLRWEWVPEKSSRRISGECEKLQREKKNSADEANESAGNVRKQDWNTELLHVQTDLWVSFHLSCTCFKVLGRQPVLPKLTSWCCGKC